MTTLLPTFLPRRQLVLLRTLALLACILLSAALALWTSAAASAAVFVVNTTLDGADGVPGDGACDFSPVPPPSGLCSLRAAVEEANALGGAHEIRFAVGGGGLQTLDVNGPTEIEITAAITIRGETQAGFVDDPLIHLHFDGGGLIPGLSVTGNGVIVRSLRISGFPLDGISLTGSGARVEGCWIGLDDTGSPDANFRGLGVVGIGHEIGDSAAPANVISGNFDGGVVLGDTAFAVLVRDNLIGTDPTGTVALGNGNLGAGVKIDGTLNLVEDNLISGNKSTGVWITGNENDVKSNFIGVSVNEAPLGNGFAGVFVAEGANDTIIGGSGLFDGNIISGNAENDFGQGGSGILVAGASDTEIYGNFIGTDSTGTFGRGNEAHGVHVTQSGTTPSDTTHIGMLDANGGGGNVISANGGGVLGGHGIFVELSDLTSISNNRIGLGAGGLPPSLPNQGDGVRIVESTGSFLGGPPIFGTGPNLISQNDGAGVAVLDPDAGAGSQNTHGHWIDINNIWQNGGLSIDLTLGSLTNDGPSSNDAGDSDHGPNRLQNFPLINDVAFNAGTGESTITGTLNSNANTDFKVHVYDNPDCEMPDSQGHAQTFLGEDFVTTNGSGNTSFSITTTSPVTFPAAVAIVDDGDPNLADTSEVSPCYTGLGAAGILGDYVWLDVNGNGLQDLSESGVEGITVRLFDDMGGLVAETETDAEGFYRFTGLASDTYELEFDAMDFTTPDVGADDEIDSDVTIVDRTDPFVYTAGTVDLSRDAGLPIEDSIFQDGFESADLSEWSAVVN